MKKRRSAQPATLTPEESARRESRLKKIENTATFGLLLVCVGMAAPLFNLMNVPSPIFMWIFAAGALIFTVARLCNVADPADTLRIRRLRRLEFWAGMAFCIASGLWFYNYQRLGSFGGSLAVIRPTVVFVIAGAAIQVIAAWLIHSARNKQSSQS
ncbi:MAG: hypothetical protein K2O24_02165 [Muribaculaceae bacterium]|nr:hypothetical protein [Muribaculaceae bacterium]